MRRFAVVLIALLGLTVSIEAAAQGKNACDTLGTAGVLINAQGMDSSQSFTITQDNTQGGYGVLTLFIALTDANTSITRFDMVCTGSEDNNATGYILQSCAIAAGVCTSTDSAWRKASPGTKNWPWRVDIEGFPDVECTFSVGTGAGAAADLLTVKGRMCVK